MAQRRRDLTRAQGCSTLFDGRACGVEAQVGEGGRSAGVAQIVEVGAVGYVGRGTCPVGAHRDPVRDRCSTLHGAGDPRAVARLDHPSAARVGQQEGGEVRHVGALPRRSTLPVRLDQRGDHLEGVVGRAGPLETESHQVHADQGGRQAVRVLAWSTRSRCRWPDGARSRRARTPTATWAGTRSARAAGRRRSRCTGSGAALRPAAEAELRRAPGARRRGGRSSWRRRCRPFRSRRVCRTWARRYPSRSTGGWSGRVQAADLGRHRERREQRTGGGLDQVVPSQ